MPSKPFKVGSVIWSLLISIGVIACGVSVLLPSTKRARIQFNQVGEDPQNVAGPSTQPSTQP